MVLGPLVQTKGSYWTIRTSAKGARAFDIPLKCFPLELDIFLKYIYLDIRYLDIHPIQKMVELVCPLLTYMVASQQFGLVVKLDFWHITQNDLNMYLNVQILNSNQLLQIQLCHLASKPKYFEYYKLNYLVEGVYYIPNKKKIRIFSSHHKVYYLLF